MKIIKILTVTLLSSSIGLASSVTAQAEQQTGFYLQGNMGLSIQQQRNIQRSTVSDEYPSIKLGFPNKHKTVFATGIAAGYDFKPQFALPIRTELEYMFRTNGDTNGVSTLSEFDGVRVSAKNKVRTQTLMANSYYDINTGTAFTPYVSVGLGLAFNQLQSSIGVDALDTTFPSKTDTKTRFAWSIGTGVNYAIDKNWSVGAGYRFIDAGKAYTSQLLTIDSVPGTIKANVKVQYHDIALGVRYTF